MQLSALERMVAANHASFMMTSDRVRETLAHHGLTQATATALWAIDPDEPPPTMTTMAQRLFCNAPNLTFVANQLIKRRLVARAIDPSDRRSRVLSLTEEGARVRAEVIEATLERTPFATLNAQQLATLAELTELALTRSLAT